MQPKGRRSAAKHKRRSSHAASLRKYTDEERREREKHHGPVEREHFEEVIRRLLIPVRPSKQRDQR